MSKPAPPKPPKPTAKMSEGEAKAAFAEALAGFFEQHNPAKLQNIDTIIDKYHGEELVLVNDLNTKYKGDITGVETRNFVYLAGSVQRYTRASERYTKDKDASSSNSAMAYFDIKVGGGNRVPRRTPPPPPPVPAVDEHDNTHQRGESAAVSVVIRGAGPPPRHHPPPIPAAASSSGAPAAVPPPPPPPPQAEQQQPEQTQELKHNINDDGGDEAYSDTTSETTNHSYKGTEASWTGDDPDAAACYYHDDDDEDESVEGMEDGESEQYQRRSVHSFRFPKEESDIIKEGEMVKLRARDGAEECHFFMLRRTALCYVKDHSGNYKDRAKNSLQVLLSGVTGMNLGTDRLEEELTRSIDLNDVLVSPLPETGTRGGASIGSAVGKSRRVSITSTNVVATVPDDGATFRLFTRQKSFFLRCVNAAEKEAWMAAITKAAEAVQVAQRGKTLEPYEVVPIRVIATTQESCMVCHKHFYSSLGLVSTRHHHCRACGAVVCLDCSRDKSRIPTLDERALFKVCVLCSKELKAARRYGARRKSII